MRDFFYLILSLLSPFLRYIYRNRLRVLAYHGVPDPEPFEKQLRYLKSNYSILQIEELDAILNNNSDNLKLPKYAVLITFDDGIYNFKKNAFPLLKKYNIPACLFIITEVINSNQMFWWDALSKELIDKGQSVSEIRTYLNYLKKTPNSVRKVAKANIRPLYAKQLTSVDLHYFWRNGISIGNHSHTHPMFDKCSDDEIILEIENSNKCFDDWNIDGFKYFAYPNGNYSLKSENFLKKYSISLAFKFEHKINNKKINPLRIDRISTNSYMGLNEFRAKVSGLHSLYNHFVLKIKRLLN